MLTVGVPADGSTARSAGSTGDCTSAVSCTRLKPGRSDGELAGGLYGVSIGGLFAGESMFYRPGIGRDASKVALVALVDLLQRAGGDGRLLDVQWQTPHLASLGAVELPREEYLQLLQVALRLPPPDWSSHSIS